jgi:hypothetical protein
MKYYDENFKKISRNNSEQDLQIENLNETNRDLFDDLPQNVLFPEQKVSEQVPTPTANNDITLPSDSKLPSFNILERIIIDKEPVHSKYIDMLINSATEFIYDDNYRQLDNQWNSMLNKHVNMFVDDVNQVIKNKICAWSEATIRNLKLNSLRYDSYPYTRERLYKILNLPDLSKMKLDFSQFAGKMYGLYNFSEMMWGPYLKEENSLLDKDPSKSPGKNCPEKWKNIGLTASPFEIIYNYWKSHGYILQDTTKAHNRGRYPSFRIQQESQVKK